MVADVVYPTHMRGVDTIFRFFLFASEAEIIGLWGLGLLLLALAAMWAERRRARTARFDNVGWVPWTSIFVFCTMIGAAMVLLSIKGLMAA